MKLGIVFPHQLFEDNPLFGVCDTFYLVEELLFFRQYKFHKRKIAYHRASMKFYESYLHSKKKQVVYISSFEEHSDVRILFPFLKSQGISEVELVDTTDDWLGRRIHRSAQDSGMKVCVHHSPLFWNSFDEVRSYFSERKRFFQTDFYKHQRLSRNILLDKSKNPLGGKWSFDDENRKKYPKGKNPPLIDFPKPNFFWKEALSYTQKYFSHNYGDLTEDWFYPISFQESRDWLQQFLQNRLSEFGVYEDAIMGDEIFLNHSVLTPPLNVGLLTPQEIVNEAIAFSEKYSIPLNSTEGFVRQVLGWREFIRAVYELKGREQRTKNHWGFVRKIPATFWKGTTGILPVDKTIHKILKTGYCHHIERLMVLGNFMLLCEFDPNEVYLWFMEMFVDSYDWVMVPNVYGMSQFADGGLLSTKPYISGSNYLMKMSDYPKGEWQAVWDGLFWRFLHKHRSFFLKNPRLGMLVGSWDRMEETKRKQHLKSAERFIKSLDSQ